MVKYVGMAMICFGAATACYCLIRMIMIVEGMQCLG